MGKRVEMTQEEKKIKLLYLLGELKNTVTDVLLDLDDLIDHVDEDFEEEDDE